MLEELERVEGTPTTSNAVMSPAFDQMLNTPIDEDGPPSRGAVVLTGRHRQPARVAARLVINV